MLHDRPIDDVPGAPPELMALLRAGLSPDPAARPQGAVALRDALADPRGYVPVAAPGYDGRLSPPSAPVPDYLVSTPTWDPQVSAPTSDRQGGMSSLDRQSGMPSVDRQGGMAGYNGRMTTSARHRLGGPAAMPTGSAWRAGVVGTARRRLSPRHVGVAAGLIVIIAAALIIGVRFFPHGAGPGGSSSGAQAGGAVSAADVFGVATRSAGCPAAALRVATARCPATPECFNGLTVISGAANADPLHCNVPHVWETFAIAILPAEVQTFDQPTVAADPTVRRVCSEAVMLASRQGPARRLPAPDWDIQVLPPSEASYDSGSRVYRCLANEIAHEPRASQFRR
jgi:hypothetical protein